jgi:hypothetical protein
VCLTGIGVFILVALLFTNPITLLLPFGPLVLLKNPWPPNHTSHADIDRED